MGALQRSICHEFAEDFNLRSASLGVEPGRHVVVWREDGGPPCEVVAAEEEEAALEAEAKVRREREETLARMAAIDARQLEASVAGKKRERGEKGIEEEEVVDVKPISKIDRRTFAEVKRDLAALKKAKVAVLSEKGKEKIEAKEDEEEEEVELGGDNL